MRQRNRVEDALEFLEWAIVKGHFDFYPDENDETNFKPIINETQAQDQMVLNLFWLKKQEKKNLPNILKQIN